MSRCRTAITSSATTAPTRCSSPSAPGPPPQVADRRLPDTDAVGGIEPEAVAGFGAECLMELVEVADDVGPELRWGVRVDREELLGQRRAGLDSPDPGPVPQ